MEDMKRIIEINGVKVEVDLREATRVDRFRVGMKVKVLIKEFEAWKTHIGAIVAFDEFKTLPTITVCYIEAYGGLKFTYLNAESKDIEIAPAADDDLMVNKEEVMARMERDILTAEAKVDDLKLQREFFVKRFGAWFEMAAE